MVFGKRDSVIVSFLSCRMDDFENSYSNWRCIGGMPVRPCTVSVEIVLTPRDL